MSENQENIDEKVQDMMEIEELIEIISERVDINQLLSKSEMLNLIQKKANHLNQEKFFNLLDQIFLNVRIILI